MKNQLDNIYFGSLNKPLPNWRDSAGVDDDPDDEEIKTPQDIIDALGFDPAEDEDEIQNREAAMTEATDKLVNNVLEELTGVQAKWLAGVKPYFERLIRAGKDTSISDEQFIALCNRAKEHFPELFKDLDTPALQKAMERAMGSAAANGIAHGAMTRKVAK
jgi:hypothetical protein